MDKGVNQRITMSSELFENREDDLKSLCDSLKIKVDNQLVRAVGEQRKQTTRDIERGIEEGTILIHEMEDELKKAPPAFRSQMITRTRLYRKQLLDLSTALKRSGNGEASSPFSQAFGADDPYEEAMTSQRALLMAGTQSMNRASASIVRSQQIAVETDHIGHDTIDELGVQRESLLHTRDTLVDTQHNLSKSRKILNTMARRVMTNKMILAVIILFELAILGAVVYWKFFMK